MIKQSIIGTLFTALLAVPAMAQDNGDENPYQKADDTWISIDGTVESVSPNTFDLDYGNGEITVEMDDGDRDADAYKLIAGDKVRVSGMIDDDFLEQRTIEASSVYVENLGTYFTASAVDEEDVFITYTTPVTVSDTVVQGTVTDVDADDDEFTLNTGLRRITVETEEMAYDPLDDEGYQKIEAGDRVSVSADIDYDLFEGSELVANTIVTLFNADQ